MFSVQGLGVHRCNCGSQVNDLLEATAPEEGPKLATRQECILDGLKWETLKCAGLLLCELFRSNPKYQDTAVLWTRHADVESCETCQNRKHEQ